MLHKLISEATECDFKSELEIRKPKSWLKSVSAFANGIGGTLFFGVADETTVIGLENIQSVSEKISELINSKISPVPTVVLTPEEENGKQYLALNVQPGISTPYYYSSDGQKVAYIRLGNQSVPAPDHILNELILRGRNQTFDAVSTQFKKSDYSFTLLEATYLQRTKLHFEAKDYESFGLVTEDNNLTRAGSLLTDQHIVYNSRIFCTRWNGLEKGSVFDDALDDKEFEGNLIYLLQSAEAFVKNNSKTRFVKAETERIDKPDYAGRAITEALVNALGSEIHIDMFDDRLEITSPGGMYNGGNIQDQDINNIRSSRRNPIIADLFHRMRFMERRGSGLAKIVNDTAKLPGYTDELKPEFRSDQRSFTVVIKNVNYKSDQVSDQASDQAIEEKIISFCATPKSKKEICAFLGYNNLRYFTKTYLEPLIREGKIKLTIPGTPNSPNQKYVKV